MRLVTEYDKIEKQAYNIAEDLVKCFAEEEISKAGIRHRYKLPWVRGSQIIKILLTDYGFDELTRRTIKVPASFSKLDSTVPKPFSSDVP